MWPNLPNASALVNRQTVCWSRSFYECYGNILAAGHFNSHISHGCVEVEERARDLSTAVKQYYKASDQAHFSLDRMDPGALVERKARQTWLLGEREEPPEICVCACMLNAVCTCMFVEVLRAPASRRMNDCWYCMFRQTEAISCSISCSHQRRRRFGFIKALSRHLGGFHSTSGWFNNLDLVTSKLLHLWIQAYLGQLLAWCYVALNFKGLHCRCCMFYHMVDGKCSGMSINMAF